MFSRVLLRAAAPAARVATRSVTTAAPRAVSRASRFIPVAFAAAGASAFLFVNAHDSETAACASVPFYGSAGKLSCSHVCAPLERLCHNVKSVAFASALTICMCVHVWCAVWVWAHT